MSLNHNLLLTAGTAVAVAMVALIAAGCGSEPSTIRATVKRVVDGDTIVVATSTGTERVRYIGIDTPESVKPNVPVQCWAKRASAINHSLVDGQTLTLRFDREHRDRYGRLLAYPIRSDGLDVGAELVRRGAARTLEFPPNTAHAVQLRAIEQRARTQRRGLWRDCPEGQSQAGTLLRSTG